MHRLPLIRCMHVGEPKLWSCRYASEMYGKCLTRGRELLESYIQVCRCSGGEHSLAQVRLPSRKQESITTYWPLVLKQTSC